ncbi:MAG: sortase [Chloroflexota bacterium]|nr:sortase [Chloroflexota bacterium]
MSDATVDAMRALAAVSVAAAAVLSMVLLVSADVAAPTSSPATPSRAEDLRTTATAAPAPISTGRLIALEQLRIGIPRLGIDLPLALGDIERDVRLGATPENVALLFPTTNVPGVGGNSYIYAHARNSMFLRLWDVKVGDRVRITGPEGLRFDYAVTSVAPRVDPADTTWLDPTGSERLTLQTSTGPTSAYPRFIAVAERVAQGD